MTEAISDVVARNPETSGRRGNPILDTCKKLCRHPDELGCKRGRKKMKNLVYSILKWRSRIHPAVVIALLLSPFGI